MRVCQLVMSPSATLCHPLLGVINEYLEKVGLWTPFSQIFYKFQDISQKKGQGTYPEQFPQVWVILFWVLVWISLKKNTLIYLLLLSPAKICSLTSRTNKQYWNSGGVLASGAASSQMSPKDAKDSQITVARVSEIPTPCHWAAWRGQYGCFWMVGTIKGKPRGSGSAPPGWCRTK